MKGATSLPGAAVACILLTLAGAAALVKARSYDLWWHLETGLRIVTDHVIPRVDDYSFTSRGAPWVDHEWLFQVVLYLAHAAAGPAGLAILKLACALTVALLGYRALREGGAAQGTALAVVGLAIAGLRFRLAERPEMCSMALVCIHAAILLSLAARPARAAARLAAIALLVVVWANMHASALLAPGLALACAAGSMIDRARPAARNALVAAGLSACALLVNPFTWRILLVPLGISDALARANISNPEWAAPSPSEFPLFFGAVAAAALLAAACCAAGRPLAWTRMAMLGSCAAIGFLAIRHIGIFFAILPLSVDLGMARPSRRLQPVLQAAGLSVALGAAGWMSLVPPAGAEFGIGISSMRFPEKAADFVDEQLTQARLYNDVAFGGYLIWRGYPARRVFIDGRNEVHADLLGELSASIDDGRKWRALLDRFDLDGAVVAYRDDAVKVRDASTDAVSTSTFSELHFPRGEWALVYWDDVAMVFVRRHGRYADLASQLEYRVSRPEFWRQELGRSGIFETQIGGEEEIRRKLAQDEHCQLANGVARVYGKAFTNPVR